MDLILNSVIFNRLTTTAVVFLNSIHIQSGAFDKDFITHQVPSDGDCMFSSMALGLGAPNTSESVRHAIVNFLEEHFEEVLILLFCLL